MKKQSTHGRLNRSITANHNHTIHLTLEQTSCKASRISAGVSELQHMARVLRMLANEFLEKDLGCAYFDHSADYGGSPLAS